MTLVQKVLHAVRSKFQTQTEMIPATDLWSRYAKENNLGDLIPDGYIVYGELVGFTPDGAPIQKDYTYECSPERGANNCELYIYRVATVTPSGVVVDLSWPATKAFAAGIGIKTVPEISTVIHRDFTANDWIDRNYYEDWAVVAEPFAEPPVRLSSAKMADEGVCVRYDGPNGIYILKAKSPVFLGHESAELDRGVADIESEEAA